MGSGVLVSLCLVSWFFASHQFTELYLGFLEISLTWSLREYEFTDTFSCGLSGALLASGMVTAVARMTVVDTAYDRPRTNRCSAVPCT